MGVNSNQPTSNPGGDGDQAIIGEVLPYVPNDPKTTTHIPTPTSSWIAGISYDSSSFRLTIHTKAGSEFQHLMVYPNQFEQAKLEPSIGKWYGANIKGKHAIVHVKKVPKTEDFPKHGGHTDAKPEDRFKNPTNKRYGKIKGRYQ